MLHTILVFSPALGALIAGLFGRFIGDRASQLVTCGLMGVSALCAWIGIFSYISEPAFKVHLLDWIHLGSRPCHYPGRAWLSRPTATRITMIQG